jgi:hypothetical protein
MRITDIDYEKGVECDKFPTYYYYYLTKLPTCVNLAGKRGCLKECWKRAELVTDHDILNLITHKTFCTWYCYKTAGFMLFYCFRGKMGMPDRDFRC